MEIEMKIDHESMLGGKLNATLYNGFYVKNSVLLLKRKAIVSHNNKHLIV